MIQSRPGENWETDSGTSAPGTEPKDRFKQHGEEAKRGAEKLRQEASSAAHDASAKVREAGRVAKDRAADAARQTTEQVKSRANAVVSEQKNRIADEVHVFGEALHNAADTLDENDDKTLGRYAHQAADFCDTCSRYLRETDGSELVRGVGEFTRRHPELVLGGLFLAGVSVARFLKASDRHRDTARLGSNFDRGYEFDRGYDFDRVEPMGAAYEPQPYGDTGYGDVGMYAGDDLSDSASLGTSIPTVEDDLMIDEMDETTLLEPPNSLGSACDTPKKQF